MPFHITDYDKGFGAEGTFKWLLSPMLCSLVTLKVMFFSVLLPTNVAHVQAFFVMDLGNMFLEASLGEKGPVAKITGNRDFVMFAI